MQFKRILTIILCVCLCVTAIERARAWVWQLAVGVIIVGGGVVIAMKIQKLASDKLGPMTNPPEPPECSTNAPSILSMDNDTGLPVIEMDDRGVAAFDISQATLEGRDPYGYQFKRLFTATLQSRSAEPGWNTECFVIGWVSDYYVVTLFKDANGVPFCTNGTDIIAGRATNRCVLPPSSIPQMKLFRSTAWQ